MHDTADRESPSVSSPGGAVTRALAGLENDTAQPSLTSGIGAVIEKEHDLQTATEASFRHDGRCHSNAVDRLLRHHYTRVSANIALLAQRYEALPKPERFLTWQDRGRHPGPPSRKRDDETNLLPDLIAQHT